MVARSVFASKTLEFKERSQGRISCSTLRPCWERSRPFELSIINGVNNECIVQLQQVYKLLSPYLQFLDRLSPMNDHCQEVQRTSLGITYHLIRLYIFRPSLIYVAFFNSLAAAQESIENRMDLKAAVDHSFSSTKEIIDLTHDAFFTRCPPLKRDGNIVSSVETACLTLLFGVLDANNPPSHANEIFGFVDRGIECLAEVDHIGSTTGRAMSLDVMRIAKDALRSAEMGESQLVSSLSQNFTWLNDTAIETSSVLGGSSLPYNIFGIHGLNHSLYGQTAADTASGAESFNAFQSIMDLMGEGLRFPDQALHFP